MNENNTICTDLTGQLLVAMPNMSDPRFAKTVIYICSHSEEGAMGLVVNRLVQSLTFPDLLNQLDIETFGMEDQIRVHLGGPVDEERGFVLHSPDYMKDSTVVVGSKYALTATVDILRDMASGLGPNQSMLALGYAGWGPGQLDQEILENGWLNVPPNDEIVYDDVLETKWERALGQLGIDPRLLLDEAGHA
ncbi:YqgE/AlgH family protein [Terasakiella sp. A23]|uniref:YqgE/AlgH family protein n=1 Tax=Terasakiella sp. FCG-A23 TaxID=3080561 RepID=UPI002952ED66|nr:YqgE/AlgH family protein [Terasakiella sp. A23]MDV7339706.1 YqgE/AlgH family protein [Terasakiella sp. A23]